MDCQICKQRKATKRASELSGYYRDVTLDVCEQCLTESDAKKLARAKRFPVETESDCQSCYHAERQSEYYASKVIS